jgi:large subunit ribosomal protein L10
MSLSRADKEAVVAEVSEVASKAHSAIAAEYKGLTVGQMTDLRNRAREGGVYVRVVKNTLAKIALKDSDFECLHDSLEGPLLLAFSLDDPGAAARLIRDFSKEKANEKLEVKAIGLSGTLLGPSDLKRMADLPTYDQAIAMLMGTMRAPLDKFARTLNEVPGKFVRTVAAVRDQKQAA